MEPRQESPLDEGCVVQSSNNGPRSAAASGWGGVSVLSVGQSDLVSNPPQHEEMDDIFPLNLAMPPVVEWSLCMISIRLDGEKSYDGPLGADESETFGPWSENNNNASGANNEGSVCTML